MSLELLEKLEQKIQLAVDTIELMKMEMDELKQENAELAEQNEQLQAEQAQLAEKNEALSSERSLFQQKVDTVLGKIAAIDSVLNEDAGEQHDEAHGHHAH